jgi:hypothetical protein
MVGALRRIPAGANRILNVLNYSGLCGRGNLTCMKTTRGPRVDVRIQVSWRCRISGAAAARLLIITVLALAATAFALPAHDELARDALYGAAGLLAGARSRPRKRS